MKRILFVVIFLVVGAANLRAEDQCKDILKNGIFDNSFISSTEESKKKFITWQCTSEFSTHDEAIDAGVDVGAIVYGIPIYISGTFTKDQRDTWKKTNCSQSDLAESYSKSYVELKKLVAKEVVLAWSKCMEITSQYKPLSCVVNAPDNSNIIFNVRWKRAGDVDIINPVVTGSYVDGATSEYPKIKGKELIPKATKITGDGFGIPLKRNNDSAIMINLNTTRGSCDAYLPENRLVVKVGAVIEANAEVPKGVTESFAFDRGADNSDCDKTVNGSDHYCMSKAEYVDSWSGINVTSAAGKTHNMSIRNDNANAKCVYADYSIQGNGHDWTGHCSGTGWLVANFTLSGTKYELNGLKNFSIPENESKGQKTFAYEYPKDFIPSGSRNIKYKYKVVISKTYGNQNAKIELTDMNPTGEGVTTNISSDGRLYIDATKSISLMNLDIPKPIFNKDKIKFKTLPMPIDKAGF